GAGIGEHEGMTTPEAPGRHAPSGGLRIHYQDTGSGPPLLVLNGWTGSGLRWPAEWTSPLEQDFRLLRVCNRGTGWSDLPDEPFTIADMAADALAVLDDRGIARAHLFGLSMGGMIAQHLALHHRDRVDRVVLAATAPPMPDMVLPETDVFSRLMTPPEQGASRDEFVASIWKKIVGPGFDERGADFLASARVGTV